MKMKLERSLQSLHKSGNEAVHWLTHQLQHSQKEIRELCPDNGQNLGTENQSQYMLNSNSASCELTK